MARVAGRFAGEPMAAPNVAPLVGVLLGLFAATLIVAQQSPAAPQAELALPPAFSHMDCFPGRQATFLSLHQGRYFLVHGEDVVETAPADITARLRTLAAVHPEAIVDVRADGEVPFARFMAMVEAVKSAGLRPRLINEDIH
ncbi:MAG: biopolymer transporter ExbD [Caulobacter sp.]